MGLLQVACGNEELLDARLLRTLDDFVKVRFMVHFPVVNTPKHGISEIDADVDVPRGVQGDCGGRLGDDGGGGHGALEAGRERGEHVRTIFE